MLVVESVVVVVEAAKAARAAADWAEPGDEE
jgi:hypothetical protein